ncbi:MAG: hypothetical protein UV54_C0011G0002 [Candidatus Beckwithbacteria bacterium GW2011_GWA2_43_10]|uniref:Uncharacterized protein n=1 Tax=Candidatus Beckwithbacteria bacterium GW2011_GWA2_43_10 TaxID=1618369 RepID=A0A0G1C3N3_9BACT|nr:MAG: hypothetical protein UV54_C0011G0002 [Candidatus Beckwithbacteria bacterium GW2011_GWA2_43_10]
MNIGKKNSFIFSLGLVIGVLLVGGLRINQQEFLSPVGGKTIELVEPQEIIIPARTAKAQGQVQGMMVEKTAETEKPLKQSSAEKTNTRLKGEYRIAILGDSMVDTAGTGFFGLEKRLNDYYSQTDVKIFNYGAGATDLEYGLFRLTNDYQYLGKTVPALLKVEPDIVIVESMAYNHWSDTKEDLDRQWLTMGKIVDTIKKDSAAEVVFLTTIAPNTKVYAKNIDGLNLTEEDRLNRVKTVRMYIKNMINFSGSQGVPLINIYQASLGAGGEGKLKYISEDGLHLSEQGHKLTAEMIFDYLKGFIGTD